MKKITLLFFITSLYFVNVFSQYYQVEYSFKLLPMPGLKPSDEEKAKMQKVKGIVDDYGEYLSQHRYILIFTPEESYYHVDAMEMPDDVENPMLYEISLNGAIRYGDFYQNARTKEILNTTERRGIIYLLSDSLRNDWKITGETKRIAGYHCIKAIKKCNKCKNPIEAWFTPQIPVPFGPAGFGGLPGLILEVKKYRQVLTATKIKRLKNKPVIVKPTEGIRMTRKEYKEMLHRRRMEIKRRHKAE